MKISRKLNVIAVVTAIGILAGSCTTIHRCPRHHPHRHPHRHHYAVVVQNEVGITQDDAFVMEYEAMAYHGGDGMLEVEKAFAKLDDADQAYLLEIYQEDIFMN